MNKVSINAEQRLYVIPCGDGFSCLGFDVAERKRRAVLEWMSAGSSSPMEIGTLEHYAAYASALERGAKFASSTGMRCPAELTTALIPFEGRRVEVTYPDGEKSRFRVGKSTGWMPCHLEIRGKADGGPAVYFPAGATVRAI